MTQPRILVFSSLFPSDAAPVAGAFIRERMFRVAKRVPLVVVAPQPWSPFDWIVRLFRKSFRPMAAAHEVMDGVEVHRPRFLSLPGLLKRWDGRLMASGCLRAVRGIHERFGATLIDAHFLYPDGYAATRIGAKLGLPVTITIRGSKDEWLIGTDREPMLRDAMNAAAHLFAVSDALKRDVAVKLGQPADRVTVIGNGVDLEKFSPVDRAEARRRLGIAPDAPVIVGVGNLVEGKGFHRVIPLLPDLARKHPGLQCLIVGGGSGARDMTGRLRQLAVEHGVRDAVRLCGRQAPEDLKWFYGAADAFVLATVFEGWANVFLEAMACGLPVVTTRVGGNEQVVASPDLGILVDWWDAPAFARAIDGALTRRWDRDRIVAYARANAWDERIDRLVAKFEEIGTRAAGKPAQNAGSTEESPLCRS